MNIKNVRIVLLLLPLLFIISPSPFAQAITRPHRNTVSVTHTVPVRFVNAPIIIPSIPAVTVSKTVSTSTTVTSTTSSPSTAIPVAAPAPTYAPTPAPAVSSPVATPAPAPALSSSAPIALDGAHDMTISGYTISGGTVPLISLSNCSNIHITGNTLTNAKNVGISLYNCTNVQIDNNVIQNVSTGVYVLNSHDNIQVNDNQFQNMQGPFPRGAFVQFDTVSGSGDSISNNKGVNIAGASNPEDAISLYKSNGTAGSPIMISGNTITGGGPSHSGGGIMLGDNGGSYQTAQNNTLIDPGQYGMAVSGGSHMVISGNTITGKSQSFTNIGLYYWNQSGLPSSDITIGQNKVNFFNSQNQENDYWLGGDAVTPNGWKTNN